MGLRGISRKFCKNYVNDVYLERAVVEKEMAVVLRRTELVRSHGWCVGERRRDRCQLRQWRRTNVDGAFV